MKNTMLCLVVLLSSLSGCSSSPMDLCKQLESKTLLTKCSEQTAEDKISKTAEFRLGHVEGTLVVYKNDDEYVAHCDPKESWHVAMNPKIRACVDLSALSVYDDDLRRIKGDAAFMQKLRDGVAALR